MIRRLLFLILLGLTHQVVAQIQYLRFGNLSTDKGLSKVFVQCILQDSKGFIWAGTRDGLNVYNGERFTSYIHNPLDSSSIIGNDIRGICEDSKSNLWIATFDGLGVYERSTGRFIHYTHQENENSLKSNRITAIAVDRNDNVYITADSWFTVFDTKQKQFTHYNLADPGNEKDVGTHLSSLFFDRSHIWIGSRNYGIRRFDPADKQFKHFELKQFQDTVRQNIINNKNSITGFCEDRQGFLWIGSRGNGLYRLDRKSGTVSHYKHNENDPNSLPYDVVLSLMVDTDDNLWIGTQNEGLITLGKDRDLFTRFVHDDRDPKSLSDNSISCIYQDRRGTVWLGTQTRGICLYDRSLSEFKHYKHSPYGNSLSNNIVKGFAEDRDGNIWITTEGGGLNMFEPMTEKFTVYKNDEKNKNSPSTNYMLGVYVDSKDNIWIGTYKGGLNFFDKRKGTFKIYRSSSKDSTTLINDVVYTIFEDEQNNLWVGTMGGLNLFNPKTGKFTQYRYTQVESNVGIVSITDDGNGILIVGTSQGMVTFNKNTRRFGNRLYKKDNDPASLSNNLVFNIFKDSKSNIWVATDDGLNLFNRKDSTFRRFNVIDGLPHRCVQDILEDDDGDLWISTNKGLSHFDPDSIKFKNYDVIDGLQDNEFKRKAALKTFNGEMYFGGINGFNVFHPAGITENTYVPPVHVTDFQLFNKAVIIGAENSPLKEHISVAKEVRLPYNESAFSFDFIALNYIKPEKNQYAYMLEGFDKDWNYVRGQKRATYTNLDPGEYEFKVKASNNSGIWNNEGASVKVIITAPIWMTLWFKILAFILVAGGLIAYHRSRINAVKRKAAEEVRQARTAVEKSMAG